MRREIPEEPHAHPGDHRRAESGSLLGQHTTHGRPSTLALIAAHSCRPRRRRRPILPRPRPSASSRSTMSRSANAQPSSTARAMCAGVWFIARPSKGATIRSFQRVPSTPRTRAGTALRRRPPAPPRPRKDLGLRNAEQPGERESAAAADESGFSTSHDPGTARPCVSTRPSGSRTGARDVAGTGRRCR